MLPGLCKIFFRLLFPEEDIRRRYGIQETVLAKTLARGVFVLPTDSGSAGRALMEWSGYPQAAEEAKLGCLGVELEIALFQRYSVRLTVLLACSDTHLVLDSRRYIPYSSNGRSAA
jgi:DNA ligase-4